MAIYTFKCPLCGKTLDKIQKMRDNTPVFCDCYCNDSDDRVEAYPRMERVLATPSPMQWGCLKGF